ncbi:MAG: diphthine--ammonia ligase [Candidatus Bathyarchaeia archaeon]
MRAVVLFSGGKDSVYALWCTLHQGFVASLLTFLPAGHDSWMFHRPLTEWTPLQAEALGLPHTMASVSAEGRGELDVLQASLHAVAREQGADSVVSGTIRSGYQRRRIDTVCEKLALRSLAPLWGKDPRRLLREVAEAGFKVIISAVAAQGLDQHWVGRELTEESVEELNRLAAKYRFDIAGEGGEFETFVLGGPIFRRAIRLEGVRVFWRRDSGHLEATRAHLVDKLP